MNINFCESSPKAKAKIVETEAKDFSEFSQHYSNKYPFHKLTVGNSFVINANEANEIAIRNSASIFARKHGMKLAVLRHKDLNLIEVARIG